VTVDQLVSAPCARTLFVKLRKLELGYDSTKVRIALVWVSENRESTTTKAFRVSSESRIETADGQKFPLVVPKRAHRGAAQQIELQTDTLHQLTLEFPPLPHDQHQANLVLVNDLCGTSGRWGHRTIRFKEVPLGYASVVGAAATDAQSPLAPVREEIAVVHVHDYFLVAGQCSGTLRFSADRISFRSQGKHSFELPCEAVVRVRPATKIIVEDPLGQFEETGEIPTLSIKGRIRNKRGKWKNETWHFLAQNGLPPVLLMSKNRCSGGR
jgi:hypothetical protein